MARVGAHCKRAGQLEARGIENQQRTGGFRRDQCLARRPHHDDAIGLGRPRQRDCSVQGQRVGIDHADRGAGPVHDPDQAVGSYGECARCGAYRHLGQLVAADGIEDTDTVVVGVDHPQPGTGTLASFQHEVRRHRRGLCSDRPVDGVNDRLAPFDPAQVGGSDGHVVQPWPGKGVAGVGIRGERRGRCAVAEIPAIQDVEARGIGAEGRDAADRAGRCRSRQRQDQRRGRRDVPGHVYAGAVDTVACGKDDVVAAGFHWRAGDQPGRGIDAQAARKAACRELKAVTVGVAGHQLKTHGTSGNRGLFAR